MVAKAHTTTAKINYQLITCKEIQTLDETATPEASSEKATYKTDDIIHVYDTCANQNVLILLPLITTSITTL